MEQKKPRNWKRKYMTIEMFEKFLNNDFYHLQIKVNATMWLSLVILAVVIGTLVQRFLFG